MKLVILEAEISGRIFYTYYPIYEYSVLVTGNRHRSLTGERGREWGEGGVQVDSFLGENKESLY